MKRVENRIQELSEIIANCSQAEKKDVKNAALFYRSIKERSELQSVLDLRKEINNTLMFLVTMDLKLYGKVTEETKRCFAKQGVKFPEILN